ncbi:TPA: hypothetical protein ACYEOW_004850 [Raoultella terrigena]
MSGSKAFRPDGGGMSIERIQEIADNPNCDEEKRWLAQSFLARARQKAAAYVDIVNLRRLQRGEVESVEIFTDTHCTPLYLNPPAILNSIDTMQVTRCIDLFDLKLRIAEAKKSGLDTTLMEESYDELIEDIRPKRNHSGNGR